MGQGGTTMASLALRSRARTTLLFILAALALTAACSSNDADMTSPSCAYSAAATPESFSNTGGPGTITITTTSACAWTISSNAAWLTFQATPSGATSGTGTQSVPFIVAPNTANVTRGAIITTPGNNVAIAQSAAACAYGVAPESLRFPNDGGSRGLTITTSAPCPWTATSAQPWLRVTSNPSGSGNYTVQFTADEYFGASARSATATVAGARVNVTQEGTGCTLGISPTTQSIGGAGGVRTITVTANETCAWQAESANEWIASTGPESGSGNGSVTYTVSPNNTPDERAGRVIIEGQTLIVTQAGN